MNNSLLVIIVVSVVFLLFNNKKDDKATNIDDLNKIAEKLDRDKIPEFVNPEQHNWFVTVWADGIYRGLSSDNALKEATIKFSFL